MLFDVWELPFQSLPLWRRCTVSQECYERCGAILLHQHLCVWHCVKHQLQMLVLTSPNWQTMCFHPVLISTPIHSGFKSILYCPVQKKSSAANLRSRHGFLTEVSCRWLDCLPFHPIIYTWLYLGPQPHKQAFYPNLDSADLSLNKPISSLKRWSWVADCLSVGLPAVKQAVCRQEVK